MHIVRFQQAPAYSAPDHDDVVTRRLQGGEAGGADFALVGHSTFAPGTGVPMDAAPIGKIYVITDGAITIEQKDGTRHVLRQWDSLFVPANEARSVQNDGDVPASLIVITPTSPAAGG